MLSETETCTSETEQQVGKRQISLKTPETYISHNAIFHQRHHFTNPFI